MNGSRSPIGVMLIATILLLNALCLCEGLNSFASAPAAGLHDCCQDAEDRSGRDHDAEHRDRGFPQYSHCDETTIGTLSEAKLRVAKAHSGPLLPFAFSPAAMAQAHPASLFRPARRALSQAWTPSERSVLEQTCVLRI